MIQINDNVKQKAIKVAEELIREGKNIGPVPFRRAEDALFVSSDPDLVIGLDIVDVGERVFYIGPKK